jgi:hypothetical protein
LKRKYRKPPAGAAELERKARFPALRAGNAPKFPKKIFVMLNYCFADVIAAGFTGSI